MIVLVDTSVWSLALRRTRGNTHPASAELSRLISGDNALLLGVVRQESLCGITDPDQFESLRLQLAAYPDVEVRKADHEDGARFFNLCRGKGIQGSHVDFLICAVAARRNLAILTTDADFGRFARHLPIRLHEYEKPKAG